MHICNRLFRDAQKENDGVEKAIKRKHQTERQHADRAAGEKNAVSHGGQIAPAVCHGQKGTAAQAQTDNNRSQKGQNGIRGADRRKRRISDISADNPRVHQIVQLLHDIAEHERQGKQPQAGCDISCGEIPFPFHDVHFFL